MAGEYFVVPLLAGEVLCSSVLPAGYVFVCEWYHSDTLAERPDLWSDTPTLHQVRSAIEDLRKFGYWIRDFNPGNVLIGQRGLKIVDLETATVDSNNYAADEPELVVLSAMLNV